MAVGNVECIHSGKLLGNRSLVFSICDDPQLMAESVNRCNEIVLGILGCVFLNQGSEYGIWAIGKEDGLNICVRSAHVLHAVVFFVAAREFVLLDDSIHIVVHVCAEHNAVLRLAVHGLRIQVVALVCILHEPALLLEMGKLLGTAFIDTRVVFAGAFGEIDFGFDDMIERFEVIACFGAGFLRTQYIVGAAFHFFHQRNGWANAAEGFYSWHNDLKFGRFDS